MYTDKDDEIRMTDLPERPQVIQSLTDPWSHSDKHSPDKWDANDCSSAQGISRRSEMDR
jgi:hypothetical protein